jgi:hypothetical protein
MNKLKIFFNLVSIISIVLFFVTKQVLILIIFLGVKGSVYEIIANSYDGPVRIKCDLKSKEFIQILANIILLMVIIYLLIK